MAASRAVHLAVFALSTLSLLLTGGYTQQSSISAICNSATNCTECMAAHPGCNWCIAKPTDESDSNVGWKSKYRRCDSYGALRNNSCPADDIKSITTKDMYRKEDKVRDATDDGKPAIQLSPQILNLTLRPNEKVKVNVTFRLAKDYPVDLYYLMDLSQSMDDDKKKVANLGVDLAVEMRKLTKDVRLGFGSFVDKVLMPYVNTLPDRLRSPCSNCESPYSFKHRLKLSNDTSIFAQRVNQTRVSGNLDEPEGGFDALMQAVVCDDVIGWRANSRKMLIFSTDAPFHSAGDGKLGGVVEPNDGLCHMHKDEYTWAARQDYPSISQIASKVADNRVNVIFAVTSDQTDRYQALSDIIDGSVTGELARDSGNIVDLVKRNYREISSKVLLTVRRGSDRNELLNIKVRADCDNSGKKFADTAQCDNLAPMGRVKFQVELQATSCANAVNGKVTETFEVYPTGVSESLKITATVDCACECGDIEPRSSACSNVGTYQCGTCSCGDSHYGNTCQCDIASITTDKKDADSTCIRPNSTSYELPCSGRGECVCGECEVCNCLPGSTDEGTCKRFTGKYCQCNPDNCPRNSKGICSGRGQCQCDEDTAVHTCRCDEGYSGYRCDCQISNDTCYDPQNPEVQCNGQGRCECGACKCFRPSGGSSERFTGQYCEECSTCTSKCQPYKQCVQCFGNQEFGWQEEITDSSVCSACFNDSSIQFEAVEEVPTEQGVKPCAGYTSTFDDCQVAYGYKYSTKTGYTVYVRNERDCPFKPNLIALILGVVGGIVLLGVVALLIWKLVTTLHDRREFAKFEKERQGAQWNENENPIYVQATSTFKNPMYQGSTKKM